jgi:hypothetical protein
MQAFDVNERTDEELRRLLKARSAAAAESALRSGGQVSAEEIEELDRLTRLIDVRSRTDPPKPQRSWRIAALLAATLLVVSGLLFARVRETAIELDVQATEVSFALPSKQVLLENVALASLGASGLKRIELPDSLPANSGFGDGGQGEDQAIQIAIAEEGGRRGSVGISAIVPAAGTQVWLRCVDPSGQYRLSLSNPHVVMSVDVYGPVVVSSAGVGPRTVDFSTPRAVVLEAASGILDLDLTFQHLERVGMMPQVPVNKLAFFRVAERSDRESAIVRRLSTITSGTLYFESLKGATRTLRGGEALRFQEARGEIRTLRLGSDHLTLNFQGRVRGMRTGSDDNPHTLMPTWLEWLSARHGLSLLWGTTFYLFGMALAVIRWFKVSI